jgi:hypothetical protein
VLTERELTCHPLDLGCMLSIASMCMLVAVLMPTLLFEHVVLCCIIRVRNDLNGPPHVPKGYVRVPLTAAAASQRDATPYKFERIEVRSFNA